MLKLTLCDVLESEFINLTQDVDPDLPPDSKPPTTAEKTERQARLTARLQALEAADAHLRHAHKLAKTDPSYITLRNAHLKDLAALESRRDLSVDDPRRKAAQQASDESERPRLERLIKFQSMSDRTALCFSGGGIRSATFCLGVLQGLSHHHLLTHVDYLSTVSGGGYIGSWLAAWNTRKSMAEIEKSLSDPPQKKLDGEIPQIEHLRTYSNYLTPKLGILSADTWTLIATVIRNMFLNWMILVPMMAVALLMPRLALAATLALPRSVRALWILLIVGFILAVWAVRNINKSLPSVGNKSCTESEYLIRVLAPLSASAILLNTFWVGWYRADHTLTLLMYCAFGAALHVCGWFSMSAGRTFARERSLNASVKVAIQKGAAALGTAKNGGFLIGALVSGAAGGWCAHAVAEADALNPMLHPARIVCAGFPSVMAIYFLATALFIGLSSKKTDDDDREWWARSGGWILIASSAWAAASVLVIGGPPLIHWVGAKWATAGGLGGLASGLLGSLAGMSSKSEAEQKEQDEKAAQVFSAPWFLKIALALAPVLFLVSLLLAISLLANAVLAKLVVKINGLPAVLHRGLADLERAIGFIGVHAHLEDPHPMAWLHDNLGIAFSTPPDARPLAVLVLAGFAGGLAWFMGRYVNVNTFSLHAMYRSRLIRAYLGASNPNRQASLFTGFDEKDNIPMHELAPGRPLLIINMALNLVYGKKLAWQERKAETFTVSRLHSGSARVGYQSSQYYGDRGTPDRHGITLGTAMSISGAAASPNMGYHSSPLLTFLMTFFNARLGWWLANPGYPGEGEVGESSDKTLWGERGPKSALKSLIAEALGQTDDENPYVYLSDGGHFENLGVYEMVLRRCRKIVVVDASADPKFQFEDLANAMRKIRVDLGVTIHFEKPIAMTAGIGNNVHCAIGEISYKCADGADAVDGTLIYIKPVLEPTLSVDLDQYHSINKDFPHQTTLDQFFGEAQFESYRRLGLETIDSICSSSGARAVMDVTALIREAQKHSGNGKTRRNVC